MSSTSNVQNVITNVIRPVYTFDSTLNGFVSRIELSNVDSLYSSNVRTTLLNAYDSYYNVYLGGGFSSYATILSNTTNSNNTLVGYGAGTGFQNVCNSIFLGNNAGAGASNVSNVIAIGTNTQAKGSNNILLGSNVNVDGTNNMILGNSLSNGTVSNTFWIGSGVQGSRKILMYGDLSSSWVGFGYPSPIAPGDTFDASGTIGLYGNVGINTTPIGKSTLTVNGTFECSNVDGYLRYSYDASKNGNLYVTGNMTSELGFSSVKNTTGAVADTATATLYSKALPPGQCMVSIVSDVNTTYAFSNFAVTNPYSKISIFSNVNNMTLTVVSNSITLSNSSGSARTFKYNITFFPAA